MSELTINLVDGFSSDRVRIRIDGEPAFESHDVTTKLVVGCAETLRLAIDKPSVNLEVELVNRAVVSRFVLEVDGDLGVQISVVDGKIEHSVSARPIGFG